MLKKLIIRSIKENLTFKNEISYIFLSCCNLRWTEFFMFSVVLVLGHVYYCMISSISLADMYMTEHLSCKIYKDKI